MKLRMGKLLVCSGVIMILLAVGLTCYNLYDAKRAERQSWDIVEKIQMEHEAVVEGELYIGVLELPKLGISLPVAEECTDDLLRGSPCRYKGSAQGRDLIIAAHNYKGHFGKLKELQTEDVLAFVEPDGTERWYRVVGLEEVDGTDFETMETGNWDLTLFTCTWGGQSRLAIRAQMEHINE